MQRFDALGFNINEEIVSCIALVIVGMPSEVVLRMFPWEIETKPRERGERFNCWKGNE